MRNLLQYPITHREITIYLSKASDELSADMSPGDMRPLLLEAAAHIVQRDEDLNRKIDTIIAAVRNAADPSASDFISLVEGLRPQFDDFGMPT